MKKTPRRRSSSRSVTCARWLSLGATCALLTSLPLAAETLAEAVGSLRNARIAKVLEAPDARITYFAGSLSQQELSELAKLAPNLQIVTGLSQREAIARAEEAHGIDARYATPEFLNKAKNLVWVQAMSAGVEGLLQNKALVANDRLVLTNHRGVHGPAIADHAMAMLLALTRDLPLHLRNQEQKEWGRGQTELTPIALEGRTLLVVGLGGIGNEIAKRAKAFGMTVWATRRSEAPKPDYVDRVELSPALLSLLPEVDVVAIAAPLTPETHHLFNKEAFAALKKGAILINIARGAIIDQDEMIAALRRGDLAAAGLDVTDPEPLPKDNPLWGMKNVLITPHVAGQAEITAERRWLLLRENLRRFAAGEPLYNVVDKFAGY